MNRIPSHILWWLLIASVSLLSTGCSVILNPAPLKPSSPEIVVTLPNSSVAVGSSLTGSLLLKAAPTSNLQINLSTSALGYVSVSPATVSIMPGHVTASFTYEGVAPGTATLSVTAPGYTSAANQVTVFPSPAAAPAPPPAPAVAPPATLREAATPLMRLVGAAADADEFGYEDPLIIEPLYGTTLGTQYNMLEAETAMKWIVTHPGQDTYNFQPGDELVTFAQAHQMKVRGHNLCWNVGNPDWLNALSTGPPSVLYNALKDHIDTVVSHYRGQVFAWDVVNEAVDDNATGIGTQLKDSIWYNQPGIGLTGTGYVEQAFRWAHAADPDALLFYNDYNFYTPGPKFQAVYNMLADFVKRGVPLDGVGMQMHIDTFGYPDSAGLAQTMAKFTALGLQVHITEMDVALPVNAAGVATPGDLQEQALEYQRVLSICLQNPGCTAFETWGFTDKHSWIPAAHPGLGDALPFDSNYQPKPAFNFLMQTFEAAAKLGSLSSDVTPVFPSVPELLAKPFCPAFLRTGSRTAPPPSPGCIVP